MDTVLQFLLPGVVLPLVLSLAFVFVKSRQHWAGAWGLVIIWLISYFWVRGVPVLPPREAIDWLWVIGIITLVTGMLTRSSPKQWLWMSGILVLSLLVITWPVLQQNIFALLSVEVAVLLFVGAIVIHRIGEEKNTIYSALPLAIVSGAFAVIASLGASLLLGQLTSALAATLGGFALYELWPKTKVTVLPKLAAMLAVVWLLCLIVIGRVYANLPLAPVSLLLMALVLSRVVPFQRLWQVILLTGIPVVTAVLWLVLTQDASSYY